MSKGKIGNTNRLGTKDSDETIRLRIEKSSLGRIWVTNGVKNRRIKKDELDHYKSLGWREGFFTSSKRRVVSEETKAHMREGNKNKRYNLECTNCSHQYVATAPNKRCPLCSSKGRRAKELGVKIMTEDEFLKLL